MPHIKAQVLSGDSIEATEFLSGLKMPKATLSTTSQPAPRDITQARTNQPPPAKFLSNKVAPPAPDHSVQPMEPIPAPPDRSNRDRKLDRLDD